MMARDYPPPTIQPKPYSRFYRHILILSWVFLVYAEALAIPSIPLERHCITEAQPRGLSAVVDSSRVVHTFFWSSLGDLTHLSMTELTGLISVNRETFTSYNQELAHTRATKLDDGYAFCFYDSTPNSSGIRVIERRGALTEASLAISSAIPMYCDLVSDGQRIWVSGASNGRVHLAEGALSAGSRQWTLEVAIAQDAIDYNAVTLSGTQIWVAARGLGDQLLLSSRELNSSGSWQLENVFSNVGTIGEGLRLSPRSGSFAGSVWATHTTPVSNRVTNSDQGFWITEIYEGAWDIYDPISQYKAGGYHDVFGGPQRGSNEGYLFALTRHHIRNAVFGSGDALLLLRYDSSLSAPNTQVLEGPFSGTGTVFTELALEPDPLAEVIGIGHYYVGQTGQLCRWSAPDQDGDGLPDADEALRGTQIDQVDTDQDGVSDGEEVLVRGTNPLVSDLPPATCTDGLLNGDETDVDCGGPICLGCAEGQLCEGESDCDQLGHSQTCVSGRCYIPTCTDGLLNQNERDIDCGGVCGPCPDGSNCLEGNDCAGGTCRSGYCHTPSCTDGLLNQDERNIDCGGSCDPCPDGSTCLDADDCLGDACLEGLCHTSSCEDQLLNQDERDIDCGGVCAPCPDGSRCVSPEDCAGGECINHLCHTPSCNDFILNQDESDLDCGGSCAPCPDGKHCDDGQDCLFGQCLLSICVAPGCDDGVLSEGESDIDCGGFVCARCPAQSACRFNADCQSRLCLQTDRGLQCAEATCEDQTQNGAETDVDCGGVECAPCRDLYVCQAHADCESLRCGEGRCTPPRCEDGVKNGEETDLDCGGPRCTSCVASALCLENRDCQSARCVGGRCASSSCQDGVLNQGEEGIDCGGPCFACPPLEEPDMDPSDLPDADDLFDLGPEYDWGTGADWEIDAELSDGLSPDMEEIDAEWMAGDLFPLIDSDLPEVDHAFPLPVDGAVEQDSGESIDPRPDHDIVSLTEDYSSGDASSPVDLGRGTSPLRPDLDLEDTYDPSVFQRERTSSGCQLSSLSSKHPLPLIWLLFMITLSIVRHSRSRQL